MTGIDIHLDTREAAFLAEAWRQAPEIVTAELLAAIWESELLIERETKERTPVGVGAGGGLRGSIAAREPKVLADAVIGEVGTALAHAIPVEIGTRPHFPPIQPLADWAVVKLGVPRDEARDVGFLIARKIAREGTEGAFMFTRAFQAVRAQIDDAYVRARQRIADRLAKGD